MQKKQLKKLILLFIILLLILIIFYDALYPIDFLVLNDSFSLSPLHNALFHANCLLNTINIWANNYIFSSDYYLLSITLYQLFSLMKIKFKRVFFPVIYFGLLVTLLDQMLQYAFTPPQAIFSQIFIEHFSFVLGLLQCYLLERYRKLCSNWKRKKRTRRKKHLQRYKVH